MKTIIIKNNDSGQRLDKFIKKSFRTFPLSLIYKNIRKKNIKINNKRANPEYKLKEADILTIYVKDELLKVVPNKYDFLKAPSLLDLVYEDENIILVNKKAGLIVHPDENYHFDSLVNRIKHYLFLKKEYNPDDELSFTPALVNRLDRNTSGIVIAAKNFEALKILNEKMKKREIQKYYLSVVEGVFTKKEGILTAYLAKDENKNRVFISSVPKKDFKTIKTKYKVLFEKNGNSTVEIELLTGRTHQIRAHMAYIGHPVLGDSKYGKKSSRFKRQVLCAYKIKFSFAEEENNILSYLNGKEFLVGEKCLDLFKKWWK